MGFPANGAFNAAIRSAGNRSRALPGIPNIGQNPTPSEQSNPIQPTPPPQVQLPSGPQQFGPGPGPGTAPQSPMQAPNIQPQTFTLHPPGTPADDTQYNYEPQPDGSWRVYPPGVTAPSHTFQASLPRAASTNDYIRMSRAFQPQAQPTQQPSAMPPQPTY
jgi:hypothetical protein